MLKPTIGIEVHAELKSKNKVFSKTINAYSNNANTNVNIVDLGYPGTLPTLNKEVVEMALKAALALNCKINKRMHFDRKNYFYPDLPKGYQITQQATPIGYDGYLEIEVDGVSKRIGIERIHIEEDTCKSMHVGENTLLNYNRAGVPLIEIVTKPDIKSSKEATTYVEELRKTLLYLGISDVKIEEGSMRCDTNISLAEESSSKLGTKIEIKNIGSISNVGISLEYEIKRQKELIDAGVQLREETRRFDDKTNSTVLLRQKETGNDYRYFPEPNLPYFEINEKLIEEVQNNLPVLPKELKKEYKSIGISSNNINTLILNYDLNQLFVELKNKVNPIICANLLTGDILSYLNKTYKNINDIDKNSIIDLVNVLDQNKISIKQAKEIMDDVLDGNESVSEIIKNKGLEQISDLSQLKEIVTKVLNENEKSVNDYLSGQDRAFKYLMGQIMKETKGNANPSLVNQMLTQELNDKKN